MHKRVELTVRFLPYFNKLFSHSVCSVSAVNPETWGEFTVRGLKSNLCLFFCCFCLVVTVVLSIFALFTLYIIVNQVVPTQ